MQGNMVSISVAHVVMPKGVNRAFVNPKDKPPKDLSTPHPGMRFWSLRLYLQGGTSAKLVGGKRP